MALNFIYKIAETVGLYQAPRQLSPFEALPNIVKITGIALPQIALFANKDNRIVNYLKSKFPLIEKLDKYVSIEKPLNFGATLTSTVSATLFALQLASGNSNELVISALTGLATLGTCKSLISEKKASSTTKNAEAAAVLAIGIEALDFCRLLISGKPIQAATKSSAPGKTPIKDKSLLEKLKSALPSKATITTVATAIAAIALMTLATYSGAALLGALLLTTLVIAYAIHSYVMAKKDREETERVVEEIATKLNSINVSALPTTAA